MYDFLESEGERLGIAYHRPYGIGAVPGWEPQVAPRPEPVEIEPLTVMGDESAGVVFLVDTPEAADVLIRQGVATVYVPRADDVQGDVVELVERFPVEERYMWFGIRDGYTDLYADMTSAKVIDAAGMRADELLGAGATAQAVFGLMQTARLVQYALGADALRKKAA